MFACVVHAGGELRVEERAVGAPRAGQVAVAMELGGICGSDLHYYHDGAVGDFRVTEPLVLGHEVVGRVSAVGPGVDGPAVGSPVAIHPATPCGECAECRADRRNICAYSNYLGSAARTPHIQGGFSQQLIVPADQVRALPPALDLRTAVLAEPLSVAIHAVRRAGDVSAKRILVTGAGPIGCLVVAALRQAGAAEIIVTDLYDAPLAIATAVGATHAIRVDNPTIDWPQDIDVAFDASGTPGGYQSCLERVRRGGTVVLIGVLPAGTGFPSHLVITRELVVKGTFRFDHEFDTALELLAGGIYVAPIVTHTFALDDAVEAFDLAGDRTTASKVLLDLTGPDTPTRT